MVTWPMTSRDPKRSRSWPLYIWSQISRKCLEIETWFQWSTNRKPHMRNRIVTWSMTSRDLERPRSWPRYIWGPISRKRLEIESRLQWNAYRKCYMGHRMVTWPMTSRDPIRSRSWPRYIWSQISRKRLEIGTWFQWSTNRKLHNSAYGESDRHVTDDVTWPWKVKVVTPICLGPYISKTAGDRVGYSGTPIGNAIWGYHMVTCSMTSRDPKRSRSWPRYIWSWITC